MNDPWMAELRVADRLAEMTRQAEMARRARHFAKPPPRLAARLAVALRGAADLLDAGPGSAPGTAVAPMRNSARGSAGT